MAETRGSSYKAPVEHGPELDATDARAGERKGLYRVLALSTVLALVVLGLVWAGIGSQSHSVSPRTGPNGQALSSASQ